LRGERYNRGKKEQGGTDAHQPKQKPRNEDSANTAERLAAQYKVGVATIKRDGQFAAAVDTLAASVEEEVKQKILTRDSRASLCGQVPITGVVGTRN